MATEIMKSFGALQDELEKAKDNLKAMDEHIKKLTGRDPSEMQLRPGVKRPLNPPEEFRGRGRGFPLMRGRPGARPEEEEPPAAKKRPGDTRTVFSRLSGPPRSKRGGDSDVEDELPNKPAVSSRVIATPKEPPSRIDAIIALSKDQQSKERNRRMFGALVGTLQKFRQEETRMREKEEKRAKVEKKLEENAKREKEELKRERQELFLERKRKQAEIRKIELKMLRIKEQDEWEAKNRHLLNFIQTRTKPHIFYLPKTHNAKTEERLVASQKVVAKMIEKKRQEVRLELEAIEKRGRWRQGLGETDGGMGMLGGPASDDEHPMDLGDKENRLGFCSLPEAQGTASDEQMIDEMSADVTTAASGKNDRASSPEMSATTVAAATVAAADGSADAISTTMTMALPLPPSPECLQESASETRVAGGETVPEAAVPASASIPIAMSVEDSEDEAAAVAAGAAVAASSSDEEEGMASSPPPPVRTDPRGAEDEDDDASKPEVSPKAAASAAAVASD